MIEKCVVQSLSSSFIRLVQDWIFSGFFCNWISFSVHWDYLSNLVLTLSFLWLISGSCFKWYPLNTVHLKAGWNFRLLDSLMVSVYLRVFKCTWPTKKNLFSSKKMCFHVQKSHLKVKLACLDHDRTCKYYYLLENCFLVDPFITYTNQAKNKIKIYLSYTFRIAYLRTSYVSTNYFLILLLGSSYFVLILFYVISSFALHLP